MRRLSREECEVLRRSTAMGAPGQPAPLGRDTALALFHELGKLAERQRSNACSMGTRRRDDAPQRESLPADASPRAVCRSAAIPGALR